jgi:hypothetical protein
MQHFILYKTTNLVNNKTYIGIHQTNDLDDGYLGSGLALKRAIKKYGKENFSREILETCLSFDELIEKEKIYVNEEWVISNNNYNLKTGGQSTGILSDESKAKISKTLKEKYQNGLLKHHNKPVIMTTQLKEKISKSLIERYKSIEHHSINSIPWNKNKKGLQVAWNKGKSSGPMSEELKNTISKTLKERYKTNIHPKKGIASWCKGLKLPPSAKRGVVLSKTECPYCNKFVDVGNGKRWHFDNCRFR